MYQQGPFKIEKGKDNTIEVFLNGKYELKEGDEYYETIEFLIDIIN